jgi:hypothetical protein
MSKVVKNKLYVFNETHKECEICGKSAELRPYGPNGANVCFECGMKDEKTTIQMFEKRIKNVDTMVIVNK